MISDYNSFLVIADEPARFRKYGLCEMIDKESDWRTYEKNIYDVMYGILPYYFPLYNRMF